MTTCSQEAHGVTTYAKKGMEPPRVLRQAKLTTCAMVAHEVTTCAKEAHGVPPVLRKLMERPRVLRKLME